MAQTNTDVCEALAHGQLTVLGRIPHASNVTLVATVCGPDGGQLRCVYKPISGEVPLWDFPDGTLAGREVAAYLVCAELGWDTVPHTVFRDDGPLGAGMVQRWVEVADAADPPAAPELVDLCGPEAVLSGYFPIVSGFDGRGDEVVLVHADDPRLQRMAVLDLLLNNADRKGGHILAGADGVVYGIDHGICLHRHDKLRTVLWGWAGGRIPGGLVADIDAFAGRLAAEGEVAAALSALITPDEIAALHERARRLVDDPVLPAPPEHRPIPWPPF